MGFGVDAVCRDDEGDGILEYIPGEDIRAAGFGDVAYRDGDGIFKYSPDGGDRLIGFGEVASRDGDDIFNSPLASWARFTFLQ